MTYWVPGLRGPETTSTRSPSRRPNSKIAILELGRRDGDLVEVISSPLKPGTKYVTENSFVVKADVLKSGASHDH